MKLLAAAGVKTTDAEQTLSRVLSLKGINADQFDAATAQGARRNLEGVVILRGDKTKVEWVTKQLSSLT